jgi:hypothetical protein
VIDPALVTRAQELIRKGEAVLRTARPERSGHPSRPAVVTDRSYLDYSLWAEWRNQSLSFLQRTLGGTDNYSVEFAKHCDLRTVAPTNAGLGILRAVKQDLEGGHLARLPELVHADVFSDFIEMAEHLLATGYKDAAAVIGGSVLEEHLRLLCDKHGVTADAGARPKKADTMNADLVKAGVYDSNRQKIITAWQAIRNSAAHGKYDDYDRGDVQRFVGGLRDFIDRYSA